MATLDTSLTNTALPAIATQLHSAPAASIWVVTVYQLVMVSTMLPLASLGEATSHRRVFIGGLLTFTLASFLCGTSGSLAGLIAARALQGLGAAAIMSANTALVRLINPVEQLGRALGINALVIALGLAGGPVLASRLLSFTSWHWLFLINAPVGAIAALIARRALPTRSSGGPPFDIVAAILCTAGFGLLILGLGSLSKAGLSLTVWAEWVVAGLSFSVLVWHQGRGSARMLPTDLLRIPVFALSTLTAVCAFATQGLVLVALPFLLHDTFGRSHAEVGLLIAPWPILGALMAPIAGTLSDRWPIGLLGGVGLGCLAVGTAAMALMPASTAALFVASSMAFCGFGFGTFLSPNQKSLMATAPKECSGAASGVLGVARLLGQATGAAVVSLCFAQAGPQGPSLALWIGAGFAAVGGFVSLLRMTWR